MIAATLFSGIGAPEQAMPDWRWLWHAEIERFPAAVMAQRHPGSVNLGDVTADDFTARAEAIGRPGVLVFGSPCQSYSVAGKRLGLDDPRGNLALVALGIVDRLEPRWFVFENVPGLLSSFSGSQYEEGQVREGSAGGQGDGEESRDLAAFVSRVHDIGYSGAWRVLDAQYDGVAQQRQRLLFVGYLGNWRYPASVLLEPESLCGNHPPRRSAKASVAGTLGAGSPRCGQRIGADEAAVGHLVAFGGNNTSGPIEISTALSAHGGPCGRMDFESETFVAHALTWEGFDASEDGAGPGTPVVAQTLTAHWHNSKGAVGGNNVGLVNPIIYPNAVRRLMPLECERLQGFHDHHTLITYRGKPAADGPRYKAIGNSMAVPVIRWILSRIERADLLAVRAAA